MILCVTLHQTTDAGLHLLPTLLLWSLREILAVSTSLAIFWEIPSHMMNWLRFSFFFTIFSSVTLRNLWRQVFKGRLRLRSHVGPPVCPPHLILTFSLCWQQALQFRENSRRRIPLYPKRAPVSSGDSIIETLSHKCVLVKNGEVKIVKFLQF